ncbi:conserved hypothetical protein [Trichinella spiralis]|uniref:hypothetical protein n=1 Tax=Trichinella spiralis TaxID=6334 RepID=UPI0001EFE3CF|nr:conserved hypothetical protein [Trichinella spiralis]
MRVLSQWYNSDDVPFIGRSVLRLINAIQLLSQDQQAVLVDRFAHFQLIFIFPISSSIVRVFRQNSVLQLHVDVLRKCVGILIPSLQQTAQFHQRVRFPDNPKPCRHGRLFKCLHQNVGRHDSVR